MTLPALPQPLIESAIRGLPAALPRANKQGVRTPPQGWTQDAKAARHPATAGSMTIRRFRNIREFSSVSDDTIEEGQPKPKLFRFARFETLKPNAHHSLPNS